MSDSAEQAIKMKVTVWDRLQEMYGLLGYEDEIIWDSYKPDEKKELRKKVAIAVGVEEEPNFEVSLEAITDEAENKKQREIADKIHKRNMELVDKICDSIWRQAKYVGGNLNMAISYICTVPEESNTLAIANLSTEFSIMPIFRVMKCVQSENSMSARGCCMIFVDLHARVYANWEAYCNENTLPKCIVLAPKKGILMGKKEDDEWLVQLDKFLSPAARPEQKIASGLDTTSTVVGLTASAVLVGTMAAPVLLPLATGAAIAGGVSSAWSLFRSSQQLSDRNKHEQSINVTDAEARSSLFGVAGGTLGFASGAAGKMMSSMARSGSTLSPFMAYTINGLNVSTLIVSGAGTVNGIVDVFMSNDDQPISKLQIAQLTASLFMFTHSVYNYRTAHQIFKGHQDMTLNNAKANLSRNQKRAFNKMSKETMRLSKGETAGKADIIRSLNKIPDQNAYFRDMYKMNKQFNEANVKVSFNGEAHPVLNNQPSNAMPSEIRANLRGATPAQVFQDIAQHDPTLGSQTPGQLNLTTVNLHVDWIKTAIATFNTLPHLIGDDTRDTLLNIAQLLNKTLFHKFVRFVKDFIFQYGREIEQLMRRTMNIEEYLHTIFKLFEEKAREIELTISDFIEELREDKDKNKFIIADLMKYYRGQAYPVPNKDCIVCKGKYYEEVLKK